MYIRNLTSIGGSSAGITLDKKELRDNGCFDEEGQLVEQNFAIKYLGNGEWTVKLIDPDALFDNLAAS